MTPAELAALPPWALLEVHEPKYVPLTDPPFFRVPGELGFGTKPHALALERVSQLPRSNTVHARYIAVPLDRGDLRIRRIA